MLSFRAPVVLFLKATTTKTITVPGYYRKDGTFVPPHQKVVHYDPAKSSADVLAGNGSHSQKVALKKLSKLPHWHGLPEDDKHAHVLSVATNHQKKQSAAAAVSGWKAAMLAGAKPTASQQAAFDALDPAKKGALLAEVGAAPAADPKSAALQEAIDHLKEDAEQGDLPAHEQAEDAALVAKLEAAVGAEPDPASGGQAGEPVEAPAEPSAAEAGGAHAGPFSGVLYHGTSHDFDEYDPAHAGKTTDAGFYGVGMSMSPSKAMAEQYAQFSSSQTGKPGKVIEKHVHLKKPLYTKQGAFAFSDAVESAIGKKSSTPAEVTADLQAAGYDGVVVLSSKGAVSEVTVFAPADHAKAESDNEAAAAKIDELVSGTGGHYPVKAAKAITAKLKDDPEFLASWSAITHVQRLQIIVDLAKEYQAAASASSAVSGWKKAAHAGKNPTPAQWKAFYALPAGKKAEMLSAVHAEAGGTGHLVAPAVAKVGPPDVSGLVDDEKPAAAAKPDGGAESGAVAGGAGVTVTSTKKIIDPLEGTTHVVAFSNGATATLIKLNSSESMGLPGWHDAGKVGAPSSAGGSYLADTKDEAIALLLAKQQAEPTDTGPKDGDTKTGASSWDAFLNGGAYEKHLDFFNSNVLESIDEMDAALSKVPASDRDNFALLSYVAGPFHEINQNPNSKTAKALLSAVGKLPDAGLTKLHRVVHFDEADDMNAFLKQIGKPQQRTVSSWSGTDVSGGGSDGVGSQFASLISGEPFVVHMTLEGKNSGKDISFAYNNGAVGDDVVLPHGTQLDVVGVDYQAKPDGMVAHVKVREVHEGDTKTINGVTYVLKNGRWHKVVAADEHGEVPPVLVPVDEPATPSGAQPDEPADTAGEQAAAGDAGAQTGPDVAGQPADWDVFHNTEPGHNKFWSVAVVGDSMVTHYGKIGTKGTTTVKHFYKPGAALAAASKLQKQKEAKGYKFQGGQSYPVPGDVKPAPKPASATVTTKPALESADGWPQTGPQGGSNPGGRFKDPSGQEWYIKLPATEAHAKSELLAAKLYAAAGVKVPELKLVTKDGKVGIASRWVDGMTKASHPDELAMTDGALSGFAVDAWLANWDVTGLGLDNLLVGPDGKAVRIDVGGSLLFRAQGAPKGADFGDDVPELQSLADPKKNPLSAALFSGMSKAAQEKSAERVLKISDDQIKSLVEQFGPGTAAERAALAQKLIARKASIAAAFPKAKGGKKAPVFKPDDLSAPPNFLNWGGSGKGGPSSKSWINESNHAASQAIWEAAKTGNADAVKALTAPVLDKETGVVVKHVPVLEHPSQWVRGFAQQMLNEIDYQLNPPKVFRFEGGHPLKALDEAYPVAKVGAGGAIKKLGEFIVLGDPGTVSLSPEQTPPPITYQSGKLTRLTYSKVARAAIDKLPETQRQAIKAYTGSSYSKMNKSLWSGNPADEAKAAAAGLHAVGHDVTPGTVLSRKIGLHGQDLEDLKKAAGKVLQEPAIMSTSIRPSCWSGNVHFKLKVGPGVKGLYVGMGSMPGGGALSNHSGEDEVILPPNTRLLVQSVKKSPSGGDADGFGNDTEWIVEVLVLPTSGDTL